MKILEWLGGSQGVGMSSKVIALTALGSMPKDAHYTYPHDGDDFGRCWRLLQLCPDAKAGLTHLSAEGGEVWAALIARWADIEVAYLSDKERHERGDRERDGWKCYPLMQSIIRPIEDAKRSVIRGKDFNIHVGKS